MRRALALLLCLFLVAPLVPVPLCAGPSPALAAQGLTKCPGNKCGKNVQPRWKFCKFCGTRLAPPRKTVVVCQHSGLRPNPHCPSKASRDFEAGKEPSAVCAEHKPPVAADPVGSTATGLANAKVAVVDIDRVVEQSGYGKSNLEQFARMKASREQLLKFVDESRVLTTEQAQRLRELSLKDAPSDAEKAELERIKADVVASAKRSQELSRKGNLTPEERTLLQEYTKRGQGMTTTLQGWFKEFTSEMQAWVDERKLESLQKAREAIRQAARAQGYTIVFEVGIAPYGANDLTQVATAVMDRPGSSQEASLEPVGLNDYYRGAIVYAANTKIWRGEVLFAGGGINKLGVVDLAKVVESSRYGRANRQTFENMKAAREAILEFIDAQRVLTYKQAERLRALSLQPSGGDAERAELELLRADVVASAKRFQELRAKPNPTLGESLLLDEYKHLSEGMTATLQRWHGEFTQEMQDWADKRKLESVQRAREAIRQVAKAQGYTVVFEVDVAKHHATAQLQDITDEALRMMDELALR